tara:strand:- start:17 stop:427 length:411 start_codon:yes stop_codon:yes gene_type:complete
MNEKKICDLDFGLNQEDKLLPFFKKYFNNNNIKKTNKNNFFDYECDELMIELKSRRINHNKYDSLIFGKNKWDKGKDYINDGKDVYFIFNCNDGIFLYKQDLSKPPIFKQGGRFDRGRPEIQELTHIPVSDLTKIN